MPPMAISDAEDNEQEDEPVDPDLIEPEQLSMRRAASLRVQRSYTPAGARGRSVYIDDNTDDA